MSEADNPYYNLIGMMQGQMGDKSAPFLIGEVEATAPLKIRVEDISITRENMKINTFLLAGYQRRWKLTETAATGQTAQTGGGGGYEAFSSHSHAQQTIGIPDGTYTTLDDFAVGDEVLLLESRDKQQYILLCKVV